MTARYCLYRADAAGEHALMVTDDLAEASALLGALRETPSRERMYFVTDEERDGRTLDDEEIEEALAAMAEEVR